MNNKQNDQPLVSLIIVTYNSSKYVLETLESAKAQTYKNIELIITDDCSADNTIEICQNWIDKNTDRFQRTKIITVPKNTGIPVNINRGIKAAHGTWIKPIAGDDAFTKDCIAEFLKFAELHPAAKVIHSDALHYNENFKSECLIDSPLYYKYKFNNNDISAKEQHEILLRINPVLAGAVIYNKSVFSEVGLFIERFKFWEDRPMHLVITLNNIKFYYINKKLIKYRLHSNSITEQNNRENKLYPDFELYRDNIFRNNYLHELPFIEKTFRTLEIQRKGFLERNGLNNGKQLSKTIDYITRKILSYPLRFFTRPYIYDPVYRKRYF